ncbi:hypothetical protein [Roseicella aerolata]|uniref:Uncharacterized protein n=1 Tax=Roseicella aerolata TaxID=2883479 RepID=A0A9X1I9E6_9PROT|nr:hypothetical protein [Roseicella aerolata]MCB4820347.1 hypothetical protein [Roseicella aerolata]
MRRLTLALLGLMLATSPALAGKRSGPAEGSRVAAPARPAATAPAAKAVPAGTARLQLVLHRPGMAPVTVAPSRNVTHRPAGTARIRAAALAPATTARIRPVAHAAAGKAPLRSAAAVPARFGWTQGLPPAAGIQANECPDGTMATLASGHEDVVRCMPI